MSLNDGLNCESDQVKNADFIFWSKMPYWTLREAIALMFDTEPEASDKTTSHEPKVQQSIHLYKKYSNLAERALKVGMLTDPVAPIEFILWAYSTELAIPPQLLQLIVNRHEAVIDWKSEMTKMKDLLEQMTQGFEYHRSQSAKKDLKIEKLHEEIRGLRIAKQKESDDSDKIHEPNRKSFNSLLRLVGGMAVAVYSYAPSGGRSNVINQIQNDLDLKGVKMDADTIRKWVRQGANLVKKEMVEQ